jgi:type I restriction enzyme S subunit
MAFKPHEWENFGLPIIRIQNLNSSTADFNYYSGEVDERYIVEDGDLLISWSASLDAFIWNRGKAILNQHIFKVKENNDLVTREYLFFAIREAMEEIREKVHGATMQHITRPEFEAIQIPLPPLDEQRRIAAILREQLAAVERARSAAQAQLEAAEALPAAYLREVFESEEAREWNRKELGQVCDIVARQVDPRIPEYGALPHVNGENIESGTCRLLGVKTAAEDGMISGKYLFEPGDVLYSKLRPYLRKVTVVDFRGVCSADMYPIRVDSSQLDPYFTGWLLVSNEFTRYADEESRRARMPKLNRDQLFAWKAPIPPLSEQQRIAAVLKERMASAEQAHQAVQAQLDGIHQLPAALLRRAFNGNL